MGINEILDFEKDNSNSILLVKEGIFWKAYERSAYLFCKHIQVYKVKKKYIKAVRTDVVSLGFPDIVLENILKNCDLKVREDKRVVIEVQDIDLVGCDSWREGIALGFERNARCVSPSITPPPLVVL